MDQVIPPGTCLAGFFKGCWWHDGGDATRTTKKSKTPGTHKEVDERKDILFTLESSNDLIQVGPGLVTLGQSVAEKQSSMPSVKVAYHTIKESPTAANPAFFKLTRNHDMYFQVGDIKIEDLCMQFYFVFRGGRYLEVVFSTSSAAVGFVEETNSGQSRKKW